MAVIDFAYDQEAGDKAASGTGPYTLIPEGVYHIRNDAYEVKPPQSADKHPQLECNFVLTNSENGQRVGDKTKIWFSLSPKAIPYFLQKYLDAIGVEYTFTEVQTPSGMGKALRFDPDHCLGSIVKATLKHGVNAGGKNAGKAREEWVTFEPSEFDPVNGAATAAAQAAGPQSSAGRQAPAAQTQAAPAAAARSVRGPRG